MNRLFFSDEAARIRNAAFLEKKNGLPLNIFNFCVVMRPRPHVAFTDENGTDIMNGIKAATKAQSLTIFDG